jgi:7-cyano-7-deazaguanine reductase
MENSVNKILDDIVASAKPKKAIVTGEFTPRGGLATAVEAAYTQK